jgi:uncharacterized phiE125 gp8 family phage protein
VSKSTYIEASRCKFPVSYTEAAEHLRVDSSDDRDYIEELISAATQYIEGVTGRATTSTTYTLVSPSWESILDADTGGSWIPLNRFPLISVSSVEYIAEDETEPTTMDSGDYTALILTQPGGVKLPDTLPDINPDRPDAIRITFTAGYDNAYDLPPLMRHAIKLLVAQWYENRVPVAGVLLHKIPYTLSDIINNQRVKGFFA